MAVLATRGWWLSQRSCAGLKGGVAMFDRQEVQGASLLGNKAKMVMKDPRLRAELNSRCCDSDSVLKSLWDRLGKWKQEG